MKPYLFCLLGAVMMMTVSAAELPKLDRKPKPGIYALTNTCNYVLADKKRVNLFDTPVDGVTNYITWRMVEPEEGMFRYPGLDRMMKEAVEADKFLSYGILAGVHTPDWVYEKAGIPKVRYEGDRAGYLPWIEADGKRVLNVPFLKVWEETVTAFAARLYADPGRDRINYVPVTGFPFGNGLELYVPFKSVPDFERLNYDAEARKLYIEFCCRVIDIFLRHLPDFPLGIAYTDWFGCDDKGPVRTLLESETILTYAIAEGKKHNVTIVPMGLWLGWKGVCDNPNHPMTRLYTKLAASAGHGAWEGQMGTCRLKCIPIGEQIALARKNKVDWVQFWHHDCVCPECVKVLEAERKDGK